MAKHGQYWVNCGTAPMPSERYKEKQCGLGLGTLFVVNSNQVMRHPSKIALFVATFAVELNWEEGRITALLHSTH